ncbi:MAG: CBS domain-containing protein [Chloroflexota bacterium]|nr:CBS domain-containing protein [Chloroflexota bacterium]
MQVKDLMIREFESVSPGDLLRDASEKMKSLDLDPLPVCENGKLIGMLTDAGLKDAASERGLATGSSPVRDAMTTDIASCYEDEPIEQAHQRQAENPKTQTCRGMLVLDRQGALVGIVASRALATGEDERPSVTGAVAASEPKVSFRTDPVDHMSEESFPASDPPPPPSEIGSDPK